MNETANLTTTEHSEFHDNYHHGVLNFNLRWISTVGGFAVLLLLVYLYLKISSCVIKKKTLIKEQSFLYDSGQERNQYTSV